MSQPRQAARRPASTRTKGTTSWRQVREAEIAAARAGLSANGPGTILPRAVVDACLDALSWPWSAKLSLLIDQAVIAEESAGDLA